jgi:hypothetical protein
MAANLSWIKKVGQVFVKGFDFLNSPKGQEVLAAGETAIALAYPPAEPIVALVDAWVKKAAVVEAKGEAAAQLGVNVSGEQKATAAIAAVAPDVEEILTKYKLLPLSSDSLKKINDAVLTIANELEPAPVTPPAV